VNFSVHATQRMSKLFPFKYTDIEITIQSGLEIGNVNVEKENIQGTSCLCQSCLHRQDK